MTRLHFELLGLGVPADEVGQELEEGSRGSKREHQDGVPCDGGGVVGKNHHEREPEPRAPRAVDKCAREPRKLSGWAPANHSRMKVVIAS